jgi:hypothetical protein
MALVGGNLEKKVQKVMVSNSTNINKTNLLTSNH